MTTEVAKISEGIDREYVDDALRLLYDTFAKKFRLGFRNEEDLVALFRNAVDPTSCLSVAKNGECLGVLTFQTLERDFYHLKLSTLFTSFSPIRAIRILINLVLLDDRAKEDEFIVASLAIKPSGRGLGLGTALMHEAENVAKTMGKSTMTLAVIGENEGAIRLYERLGYRTTGRLGGVLTRVAASSKEVLRMEKPLISSRDESAASEAG